MAKEKDILISVLESFCANANVDVGVNYNALVANGVQGIYLTDVKGRQYTLRVKNNNNPSIYQVVSFEVSRDIFHTNCDCNEKLPNKTCYHIVYAVMYIVIRAHKVPYNELIGLIRLTDKKIVATGASPATRTQPSLPGGDQWKSFNSSPQNVVRSIYSFDYKPATREALKNITILDITEGEEVVARSVSKKTRNTTYEQYIKYNRHNTFYYRCNCQDGVRMCMHVKAAFETLLSTRGRGFFAAFKDQTVEKNQLLAPYGLTVADAEAAEFVFSTDMYDRVTMKPPSWLWKNDVADKIAGLQQVLKPKETGNVARPGMGVGIIDFEIGFLFNLTSQHYKLGFELELIKVYEKNGKDTFKKLSIHQKENHVLLRALPDTMYEAVLSISDNGVEKHMILKGHQQPYYYTNSYQQMGDKALSDMKKYLIDQIRNLWPELCDYKHVYLLTKGSFSSANIVPVQLSPEPVSLKFEVTTDAKYITIRLVKMQYGKVIADSDIQLYHGFLFQVGGALCLPADTDDTGILTQFEHGFIKIPASSMEQVVRNIIPLLQKKYEVNVPQTMNIETIAVEPLYQVMLKELDGKFLVFHPQYVYDGHTVNYELSKENIFEAMPDGKYRVIVRDMDKEKMFFESLRVLHPQFQKPTANNFFFLPFEDTMKNNWFVETIRNLNENNIKVMGMSELKKHRYNTNTPKWEMKAGSGIDWFDLQIEISFGDQLVPLRDVRKALLANQNTVVLGDGSFGVLPEEWLKQYGMLLKMGDEQKDGSLRINKLHYTLIDELHSQIDNESILAEINEKKQRLRNIDNIKTIKPHKDIKAKLRPYQLTGFQWMQTLDEMGWGGCLADDMGLGKTLQAITFLHFLKNRYPGCTHLVICPTSLIYNWESELKKFAPTLKYHIYYGLEREMSESHFNDYDVIITSYGIIRNDLEQLMQFTWHYIILDESQAIKNPDAQTNKALQLMKSKNRMILSGTPIQNNTYDLFAQFHFINPGLLGNRDFFKTEFANPIDKNNDTEKSAQLRRLIFPFMLRRTKEQVAPDLPDKTETILWCEMPKEQRVVYNDYKNYYRNTLLEKIEEVGMAKAGMYVLEGLLRLRQICDSPVLVKDSEVTTKESVKIDELMREIEENAGGHKLLVFSQFTEMLQIIEDELRNEKVNYVYLDGSTPAEKRKEAVAIFQTNPEVRVFLISLKAGGVGLNLTAADYVYIVDPWWNPAVEQQAIDRTHRIGQTNPIFAYKMICKDTVEEKIIQLQQRKKQLANDLVTEDAGFIKKLTKDDVAFLFS